MPTTTVRAVVSDIGGVLCRYDPAPRLAALAERTGLSEAEIDRRVFASGFEAACEAGTYTEEEILQWLREAIGLDGGAEEVSEIWTSAFTMDPQVLSAVTSLGLPLAVFSNNGPLFADHFDECFPELGKLFPRRFFTCQLGARKPEPDAYAAVQAALAKELEASPDEVLFIDDKPENAKAGREMGWRTHTFTDVERLREALGDL